jgi:hypothetical protein
MQLEYGIVTKKAVNNIEDGIQRAKNLLYAGKIVFFNSLKETLREGCEYRYPTMEERNKNKNLGEKPLDKDNHLMDCFRYICQELPYDFMDMRRMSYNNYLKFFEEQNASSVKSDYKALSFREIVDILNEEDMLDKTHTNNNSYAGGYTI